AVLKAAMNAEQRGWITSERLDGEYIKELGAKGMTIAQPSEAIKKELAAIGDTMTAEWLKTAGPEGQAVIDAYRGRRSSAVRRAHRQAGRPFPASPFELKSEPGACGVQTRLCVLSGPAGAVLPVHAGRLRFGGAGGGGQAGAVGHSRA